MSLEGTERTLAGLAGDVRFQGDTVAKVVLHRWSKILKAVGVAFL
jgi:hypothetical protein